jgi:hypothetical protein
MQIRLTRREILKKMLIRCQVKSTQWHTVIPNTTVQNNDNEISLHFKPMKLIFMNYSVYLTQNLLFTCDLMMAWR